jgi:hypothetical protein
MLRKGHLTQRKKKSGKGCCKLRCKKRGGSTKKRLRCNRSSARAFGCLCLAAEQPNLLDVESRATFCLSVFRFPFSVFRFRNVYYNRRHYILERCTFADEFSFFPIKTSISSPCILFSSPLPHQLYVFVNKIMADQRGRPRRKRQSDGLGEPHPGRDAGVIIGDEGGSLLSGQLREECGQALASVGEVAGFL